nr:hypothetical protein [uncultured bacterium]
MSLVRFLEVPQKNPETFVSGFFVFITFSFKYSNLFSVHISILQKEYLPIFQRFKLTINHNL